MRNKTEAIAGTIVSDTKREAASENATVRASPLTKIPVIPSAKIIGKKTAIVVNVDAVIAMATSEAPTFAASTFFIPNSMCR